MKDLTLDEIKKKVKRMESNSTCDAHRMEDNLYYHFVRMVSGSKSEYLAMLAKEVLKTRKLNCVVIDLEY